MECDRRQKYVIPVMAKRADRDKSDAISAPEAPLSEMEARDFKELDGVVIRGLTSVLEAAQALEEIRDRRLYRTEFPTFEVYCQRRLDLTRQYANRLIRAGQVRREMETFVSKDGLDIDLPSREAILYELARIEGPQAKVEVYLEAVNDVGGGEPQSADVKRLVDGRLGVTHTTGPGKLAPSERIQRTIEVIDSYEAEVKAGELTVEQFVGFLREALSCESID